MTSPANIAVHEAVEPVVAQVAADLGLEVYAVEVRPAQNGLVRILVDRPGAGAPGTGITIGELAEVTRAVEAIFDAAGTVPFAYRLEVSSPGVEREITTDRHWELHLGKQVRVTLRAPDKAGRAVFDGIALAHDATTVTLQERAGTVTLPRADIRKARSVFDFGAPAGQGTTKQKPKPTRKSR